MTLATNKVAGGGLVSIVGAIVLAIFMVEGGYSNHPSDPGGATKYGITEQTARAHGYTGSMEELTKEVADKIYRDEYIYKPKLDKIIALSPAVGHKVIDAGVNTGTNRRIKDLQKALNALNGGKTADIKVDGVIGPATIAAMTQLQNRVGEYKACTLIIKLLDAQQAVYYMELERLKMFTVGWVDHRIGNVSCDQTY